MNKKRRLEVLPIDFTRHWIYPCQNII
uniref:Uncharacterized protein n=1 Tax=Arundo donax TaxID=35708 RepID=A0A0A9EKD3_ARUDO